MSRDEQLDVLVKVVTVLEQLGICYVIGGSHASSAHGFARATLDIDLLADVRIEQAKALAESLQPDFYADEQAIARAVRAKHSFNVIHEETMVKVDFFAVKSPFHREQLERRQKEKIGDDADPEVYVATPEDIILAKLDWYKKGNCVSNQQWKDISGVIRVQSKVLDYDYLNHWAGELGLSDLLKQVLEESLGE